MKSCSVGECRRPVLARGWCQPHYSRWHRYGDVQAHKPLASKPTPLCAVDGCADPAMARGWCNGHHQRWRRLGDVLADKPLERHANLAGLMCEVDGCGRSRANFRGWCSTHYQRWVHTGDVQPDTPIITKAPPGSGYINSQGYRGWTRDGTDYLEHRVVMEEVLGRSLRPGENVHHLNGVRTDNRPQNLELWSTSQPSGQRVSDKLAWAREFIETYGDEFPSI